MNIYNHIESSLQNLRVPQNSHPKYVIMQFHILLLALLSTQCTPTCVCRDCWSIFHAWPKLFLIPSSSKSSIRIVYLFRCLFRNWFREQFLPVVWSSFCLVLHYQPYPISRSTIYHRFIYRSNLVIPYARFVAKLLK